GGHAARVPHAERGIVGHEAGIGPRGWDGDAARSPGRPPHRRLVRNRERREPARTEGRVLAQDRDLKLSAPSNETARGRSAPGPSCWLALAALSRVARLPARLNIGIHLVLVP